MFTNPDDAGPTARPESSQTSHGERCKCAFCSKELKDDQSIRHGYGPVCAKKHDMPWRAADEGGPAAEGLAERLRARLPGRADLTEWVGRCMTPVDRFLAAVVTRWRIARRPVRVAVCAAAVLAVGLICISLVGLSEGVAIPNPLPLNGRTGMPAQVTTAPPPEVHEAKEPLVIHLATGGAESIAMSSPARLRELAARAADDILPALDAHPGRFVVLDLADLPKSFQSLSVYDREQIATRRGEDAYEQSVAALLHAMLDEILAERPDAVISVLGLPVEPEDAGLDLAHVRRTNEQYFAVMDRLGPFVPARSFVVVGSSLSETTLARVGMREAVRLRDGRPIVFRMNFDWQALVDGGAAGDNTFLLADASVAADRRAARRDSALRMEASLIDDD